MQELIEKTKILNKYQKQLAESSDENFNIFKICGVNSYENSHSSILTELLSSNSSHKFGNKFLEAFIENLKKDHIIEYDYTFTMSNVTVITEYPVGQWGRIDIMIKNTRQCIIIENKIYAGDQFEQLKRYETYAQNNFTDQYLLLYLTLWGNEASQQSAKDATYKQISYCDTIINWLERCIEITARNPIIRETLIQYNNHIKNLTNNTIDSKMNEEIIKLLSKEENIEAIFTIGNNFNNVKNYLIDTTLIPQLTQICFDLNLIFDTETYDRVTTSWACFSVFHPHWKYYYIRFEFQARDLKSLISGIVHKDENIRKDETFDKLKTKFRKTSKKWVWSDFPVHNSWGKEAMVAIKNGEMAGIFKTEIERILQETEGLEM